MKTFSQENKTIKNREKKKSRKTLKAIYELLFDFTRKFRSKILNILWYSLLSR